MSSNSKDDISENVEFELKKLAVQEPKKRVEVYLLVDQEHQDMALRDIKESAVRDKTLGFRKTIQIDELPNLGYVGITCTVKASEVDTLRHIVGLVSLETMKEYEVLSAAIIQPQLDTTRTIHNIDKVWGMGEYGANVIFGIMDTGWDQYHPDLEGAVIEAKGFGMGTTQDGHGHGCFCLGCLLGRGKASNGKYMGVCPEARAYVGKSLGDDGKGHLSNIIANGDWFKGIEEIDVVSISLGRNVAVAACKYKTSMSIMTDNLCKAGKIVCVASGNWGTTYMSDPANNTIAITCGASTKRDTIAGFTSRREPSENCLYNYPVPTIYGVGEGMISCRAKGTSMGSPLDEYYTIASGTSAATPIIAGINGLITSRFGREDLESRRLRLTEYAKEIVLG